MMKPLIKKKIVVDINDFSVKEIFDCNASLSSYHAVEFLMDTNIKVCLIQADLAEDAENVAKVFKIRCKDTDTVQLVNFDLWLTDNKIVSELYSPFGDIDDTYIIGKFYDWLDLPNSNRVIVYGTSVKCLFGYFLAIAKTFKEDMHTKNFLKNNGMLILNYYDKNFIMRIYHWLICDQYENMMRKIIAYGDELDVMEAEYQMDINEHKG